MVKNYLLYLWRRWRSCLLYFLSVYGASSGPMPVLGTSQLFQNLLLLVQKHFYEVTSHTASHFTPFEVVQCHLWRIFIIKMHFSNLTIIKSYFFWIESIVGISIWAVINWIGIITPFASYSKWSWAEVNALKLENYSKIMTQ